MKRNQWNNMNDSGFSLHFIRIVFPLHQNNNVLVCLPHKTQFYCSTNKKIEWYLKMDGICCAFRDKK